MLWRVGACVQAVSLIAPPESSTRTAHRPGSRRLLAAEAVATEATLSAHFDALLEPRISPTSFPGGSAATRAPSRVAVTQRVAAFRPSARR